MDGLERHWAELDAAEYFGLTLWRNLLTSWDRKFLWAMGVSLRGL